MQSSDFPNIQAADLTAKMDETFTLILHQPKVFTAYFQYSVLLMSSLISSLKLLSVPQEL